jgi:hypothetical protein
MPSNVAYVVTGYVTAAIALGGYTWWLFSRARTARRRADAIAARRDAAVGER